MSVFGKKFLSKKKIIVLLLIGILILAMLVTAKLSQRQTLTQTMPAPMISHASTDTAVSKTVPTDAIVSLKSDKNQYKVGEQISVAVNISSVRATDGTDLVITFD